MWQRDAAWGGMDKRASELNANDMKLNSSCQMLTALRTVSTSLNVFT